MKVDVLAAKQISGSLRTRWEAIQASNATLRSPYFHPEFTAAISRVHDNAFVAVLDDGAAFFPFQRRRYGIGKPVGEGLSDYHGLIAPDDYAFDAAELVRTCGLKSWDFNHVPVEQQAFSDWQVKTWNSLIVDLHDGDQVGSQKLRSACARARRQLERELGPLVFHQDTAHPEFLELCLAWKSAQYRRTGAADLFAQPWARALIKDLASSRHPNFAGITSVLCAGGRPIAAHFGMRSRDVLHYWFPAYDIELSRFSPGLLLLMSMIDQGRKAGIASLDLGYGKEPYKLRLANRSVPLIKGSVTVSETLATLRQSAAILMRVSRKLGVKRLVPAHIRATVSQMID